MHNYIIIYFEFHHSKHFGKNIIYKNIISQKSISGVIGIRERGWGECGTFSSKINKWGNWNKRAGLRVKHFSKLNKRGGGGGGWGGESILNHVISGYCLVGVHILCICKKHNFINRKNIFRNCIEYLCCPVVIYVTSCYISMFV